jgi:hypothetical protein
MGPPLTDEELAELYPDLTPEQRSEFERWHRGRIHKAMLGLPMDDESTNPYPSADFSS